MVRERLNVRSAGGAESGVATTEVITTCYFVVSATVNLANCVVAPGESRRGRRERDAER